MKTKMSMKNAGLLMILFLFISNFGIAQDATKGLEEIKITTSAVCDMCKTTIEKAMAYEKGVKKSSLDVESKVLTVEYNPKKTSLEKIKKAVTEAGYDADEISADPKAYDNLNPCCKKDFKH